MYVELHMIQNFVPACLNRDDTNSPKDCEFGGYRRARISSQCLKRAIRKQFKEKELITEKNLAVRTKLVISQVATLLKEKGKDEEMARRAITNALTGVNLSADAEGKTQYLLFLANNEIRALADLCVKYWDILTSIKPSGDEGSDDKTPAKSSKAKKKEARADVPDEIVKALTTIFKNGKAADLALFGRMFADEPDFNVDAAAQIAHAISTHKVSMDLDFFTAVDDLQAQAETGAGMMGTIEFNSACFYRYSVVDMGQLKANLQGDMAVVSPTFEGFVKASVAAIPTGKQNSMAAHNPPSFVLAVVRESGQPCSLANAFAKPIYIGQATNKDLVGESIGQLVRYLKDVTSMYGTDGISFAGYSTIGTPDVPKEMKPDILKCSSIDELVKKLKEKALK